MSLYCRSCAETLDTDRGVLEGLWDELARHGTLDHADAIRALRLLWRVSHGKIQRLLGDKVARYYPTPKRYPGRLGDHKPLWWTFHATGGVSVRPVLVWFSGEHRGGDDGVRRLRGGSTHFVIEHDGTIWYLVNVMDGAWHCGGRNADSLSVELVNACALHKRDGAWQWWRGPYRLPYKPISFAEAWRGGRHWQPYDERQIVSLVLLMRLCSTALGRGRFDETRVCQHSQLNAHKLDCGPVFPGEAVAEAGLGALPLASYPRINAFLDELSPMWDADTEVSELELAGLEATAAALDSEHADEEPDQARDLGDEVAELKGQQQILAELGMYSGAIDGVYGPLTRRAVIEFQRAMRREWGANIVADGIIGPKTAAALVTAKREGFAQQ